MMALIWPVVSVLIVSFGCLLDRNNANERRPRRQATDLLRRRSSARSA